MSRHIQVSAAALIVVLASISAAGVRAQESDASPGTPQTAIPRDGTPPVAPTAAPVRTGLDVYRDFREGLAQPECAPDASTRWRAHFAGAPKQLASQTDDLLPLFAYVVDAVRQASLPTEYALIPFVESGYKPGARSPLGPTGLWQMIAVTARNHKIPIRHGYDGRLSPVESTRAAVRYLKTLHGMFAGDWRLAVMAYNAGEYRIFGSLKRAGQAAREATPEQLPGLAPITHAYVRKLHALSCLLVSASENESWVRALDRPVPQLAAVTLPPEIRNVERWASMNGQDASQLRRLNPVLAGARPGSGAMQLPTVTAPWNANQLLAATTGGDAAQATAAPTFPPQGDTGQAAQQATKGGNRRHTVARGDTLSGVAKRYGIGVGVLLERNGLTTRSMLHPGNVLNVDADEPAGQ
ncbi:MAG: transglycosylase SLT domain-containing protein [Pseudomonadota bacterium]|nr:transglycosylase SLT domain-containing protein [Pseudomonadota bacterium]